MSGKKIRGGTENSMANSMLVLPQLIKTANFVEEVPDQKSRDFLWRNYVGRYRYDGQDYAVMLKVKVPPTGSDRYYYHTLDKIEIDPLHVRLANTTSLLELIRKESISDEGIPHTPAQEYESLTHNIPQTEENSKPKNLAESPVDTILNAGQGPAAENPAVDADAETKAVKTLLQPAKEPGDGEEAAGGYAGTADHCQQGWVDPGGYGGGAEDSRAETENERQKRRLQ